MFQHHCLAHTSGDNSHNDENVLPANDENIRTADPPYDVANEGHDADFDVDSMSDRSDADSILSCNNIIEEDLSPFDMTSEAVNLLADPAIAYNDYVTVSIDAYGELKPKSMRVSDYIYHPKALTQLCLWDFLSMTNKIYTNCKSGSCSDGIDSNAESSRHWDERISAPESFSLNHLLSDITECMY